MVAVSALLPLQYCLDLALKHTTWGAVWDLGGSLSLSVVLKVFGMLFMTRSHVQGWEISLGDAACYRVLSPPSVHSPLYFLVTWASGFGLLIRKLEL